MVGAAITNLQYDTVPCLYNELGIEYPRVG